ncbi:MAG: hypothetical protein K8I60_16095 [Anaerolineae bacterium]|nr:hypothetical protein [Anaerolineae bacterium]
MAEQLPATTQQESDWKTRTYVLGTAAGTLFGFLAAYLYTRSAEDEAGRAGKPGRIGTGELIGLILSGLGLVRQIAEMGKPPKKK